MGGYSGRNIDQELHIRYMNSQQETPPIDFLVIGAQKSGTTALYEMLKKHSEIDMSHKKEIHFFDNDLHFAEESGVDYTKYNSKLPDFSKDKIRGEITPIYMYWEPSAQRIKDYNPNIKLIAILRNPIERAYSHWQMEKSRGKENLAFEQALKQEKNRLACTHPQQHRVYSYTDRGFYSKQIERLNQLFSADQVLYIRYEDFLQSPDLVFRNICKFLGVSQPLVPIQSEKVHCGNYDSDITRECTDLLNRVYEEEYRKLEKLLNWKLDSWRKKPIQEINTPSRDIIFYRDIKKFQGGHLKVYDYFSHLTSSSRFTPHIEFSNESIGRDDLELWNDKIYETAYTPNNGDYIFVAGMDWKKLPDDTLNKPIVNLIQGLRHADEKNPLYQFLSRKAVRICVSKEVHDAIIGTGLVNGPTFYIENCIDLNKIPLKSETPVTDFVISGMKNPQVATEVACKLESLGYSVITLTTQISRYEYLDFLAKADSVILLPYANEGYFLPALEAMAMGQIPIVPDCVGNRGFCFDNNNSIIPKYTVESIVSAALKSHSLPEKTRILICNEAKRTANAHGLEIERRQFLEIMNDIESLWKEAF